jgi:hypothetical protein
MVSNLSVHACPCGVPKSVEHQLSKETIRVMLMEIEGLEEGFTTS